MLRDLSMGHHFRGVTLDMCCMIWNDLGCVLYQVGWLLKLSMNAVVLLGCSRLQVRVGVLLILPCRLAE